MRLKPASLLNSIRRVKSASRYQSAKLTRLAFLRSYLADVMFNNARSAVSSQRYETRVAMSKCEAHEVCVS